MALCDRALSAAEVSDLFDAGSAGMCKTTMVAIDIKPGSTVNPINPRSRGNVPVAILGSASFDPFDVDTALFGPGAAAPAHAGHPEDVNGDGFLDLLLHFRTPQTGIASGDTQACVSGALVGGGTFEGCDAIATVGR